MTIQYDSFLFPHWCSEGYLSSVIGWHWDEMRCEGNLCRALIGQDGGGMTRVQHHVSHLIGVDWEWEERDYFYICHPPLWRRKDQKFCGKMNHFPSQILLRIEAVKYPAWCLRDSARASSAVFMTRATLASAMQQITRSQGRLGLQISDTKPENWIGGRFYSPDKTIRRQYSLSWCLFQRHFCFWLDKNNQLSGDGYHNGRWDGGEVSGWCW